MPLLQNNKLLIILSALSISFIGVMSFFVLDAITTNVINQEISEMENTLNERKIRIETLNERASQDMIFALKNPVFTEYFELDDTKSGNTFDNNGTMQFTESQRTLKTELEAWIWNFQNKFQIDETCLIDMTGQEHARLVFQSIEVDELLSPDEKDNPFFKPAFAKNLDEVHIEPPYISPDSHRWVIAYNSPIVLDDFKKPAIYHFEIPIIVFQEMVNITHGRMYIVDPAGHIIADSAYDYSENKSIIFEEHFPYSDTIFPDSLLSEMNDIKSGHLSYSTNGEQYHITFDSLSLFNWILVYEESEALMLLENNTPFGSMLNTTIMISSAGIGLGAFVMTFLLINRIITMMAKLQKTVN